MASPISLTHSRSPRLDIDDALLDACSDGLDPDPLYAIGGEKIHLLAEELFQVIGQRQKVVIVRLFKFDEEIQVALARLPTPGIGPEQTDPLDTQLLECVVALPQRAHNVSLCERFSVSHGGFNLAQLRRRVKPISLVRGK